MSIINHQQDGLKDKTLHLMIYLIAHSKACLITQTVTYIMSQSTSNLINKHTQQPTWLVEHGQQ